MVGGAYWAQSCAVRCVRTGSTGHTALSRDGGTSRAWLKTTLGHLSDFRDEETTVSSTGLESWAGLTGNTKNTFRI
jgi:hypothetical protein